MSLHRNRFFETMEAQGVALTYDDVRLVTAASDVSSTEADISSYFSKHIPLRTPIVSAAMDTVTTAKMAIAMAKAGGIGVIHAGLSPDAQAKEVRKVKYALNNRIEQPICVRQTDCLRDVLQMCRERDFDFRTFPVIDAKDRFVGLITQNDTDMAIGKEDVAVKKIMTPASAVTTASVDISDDQAMQMMREAKKKTLPLIDAGSRVVGMYVWSDVERMFLSNPEQYNLDAKGRLIVAAAVPTDDGALERIEKMKGCVDVVVLDSAQGDSKYTFETLKKIKKTYPGLDVVVGNISSGESAKKLAEAGADGIKVGQGPGSICTTRVETGIGCPQVTAVYECDRAVKEYGIPVCADGGITNAGDISIAIAAGASSVMLGSKLAGTKEAPGDLVLGENGGMVKMYRGMGSPSAMRESEASRKRYGVDMSKGTPLSEGVESYVPYVGSVHEVLDHFIKALRKSMSYVGSADISFHQTHTRFVQITNAGYRESHPHDVSVITKR